MIMRASTQAAVEYVGAAGGSVARTLSGFAGDAKDFLEDHPLLLLVLVVLAFVFFKITRPRTH
jgi:hypothetical protein